MDLELEQDVALPAPAMRRFPPAFLDSEVERAFRAHVPKTVRALVSGGLATSSAAWLVLYVIFRANSTHMAHGWSRAAPLMIVLAAMSMAVGFAVTRMRSGLLTVAAISNCATGFAALILGLFVVEQPVLALGGVLAVIMYSAAFFRLPIRHALFATLPYVVLFQWILLREDLHPLGPRDAFAYSVLLWCFEAFAVAAAYVNEISARTLFAQQRTIEAQQRQLEREREKSERLLRNVLPEAIAQRLREGEESIADVRTDVTILFADVVGFTSLSQHVSPSALVGILNRVFTAFDELAERHQLEKIKTIGDAYMAAAGTLDPNDDHAGCAAEMALGMLESVARLNETLGTSLQIRVGINSGNVVAGVIGRKKFTYDLWGDAVNTAARMESHGLPGEIQVTESTEQRLADRYRLEPRGVVEVKGKGAMKTYFLRGRRALERP